MPLAQPFDRRRLEMTGDLVPLGGKRSILLGFEWRARRLKSGELRKSPGSTGRGSRWPHWVPRRMAYASISPDGSRVVADLRNQSDNAGLWLLDRAGVP